jgi:hypothetical protein
VGAVAVLAVGGWWWVAEAPRPVPPAAQPVAPPAAPVQSYIMLDAESGEVIPLDAGRELPEFPDTVRRDVFSVHEGTTTDWPVRVQPGGRYLLQHVCLGLGELLVRVDGTLIGSTETGLACGDGFASTELTAANRRMVISVSRPRPQPGPAEVAIQLVALN